MNSISYKTIPNLNNVCHIKQTFNKGSKCKSLYPVNKVNDRHTSLSYHIQGKDDFEIELLLDTGAAENILPIQSLSQFKVIKYLKSVGLKSYSGNVITAAKRAIVLVNIEGFGKTHLTFSFVDNIKIGLLGLPFFRKTKASLVQKDYQFFIGFKLSFENNIFKVETLEDISIKPNSVEKKKVKIKNNRLLFDLNLRNISVKGSRYFIPILTNIELNKKFSYIYLIVQNTSNVEIKLNQGTQITLEKNLKLRNKIDKECDIVLNEIDSSDIKMTIAFFLFILLQKRMKMRFFLKKD